MADSDVPLEAHDHRRVHGRHEGDLVKKLELLTQSQFRENELAY